MFWNSEVDFQKAARSGCAVNRAVIVLPLTVPEDDCKPPELNELNFLFLVMESL